MCIALQNEVYCELHCALCAVQEWIPGLGPALLPPPH